MINFIKTLKSKNMKYLYIILISLISVQMYAQTVGVVGQEYLPNPGVCTTQSTVLLDVTQQELMGQANISATMENVSEHLLILVLHMVQFIILQVTLFLAELILHIMEIEFISYLKRGML